MIQIYSTFEHSHYIELAISKLEENGIRDIYAVPLDNRRDDMKLIDTMHGSDGTSLVDLGLILATMSGTVGVARGFVLEWGPVFWGLIAAAGGFAVGFLVDLGRRWLRKRTMTTSKNKKTEVILIVKCEERQTDFVEKTLWEALAMGVAKTRIQPPASHPSASLAGDAAVLSDDSNGYSSAWT